ncbi:MAG: protein jag [Microgenomates group bacterium]
MEKIEIIKKETEELLKKIIDNFTVEVVEELGVYQIVIKSDEEASVVIGRHGETIRAIQKILEVILYKKFGQSVEILVNVNDFREKQKERLEVLANEYAQKTQMTGSPSFIRNLSSYERKLIHEYITQKYPDLTTYSIGEGRDRRLVIDLKTNAPVRE